MDEHPDHELLWRAALRAGRRHTFLASALEAYQAQQRMSRADLAAYLGCALEDLPKLALCRLPEPTAPRFRQDVERIAAYVPVDSSRLAQLLRQVAALTALQSTPQVQSSDHRPGFLLAARERRAAEPSTTLPDDQAGAPEDE